MPLGRRAAHLRRVRVKDSDLQTPVSFPSALRPSPVLRLGPLRRFHSASLRCKRQILLPWIACQACALFVFDDFRVGDFFCDAEFDQGVGEFAESAHVDYDAAASA